MIIFSLVKFRYISTLVTLLMTLQMSACGTEEFLTAVAPDLGTGSEPVTEIVGNHTAIISGDVSGSVTEDADPNNNLLEVSGTLSITDPDIDEAAFKPKTVYGDYGELTIFDNGHWIYTADNNHDDIQNLTSSTTLTESLPINSVDGTPLTIVITIFGTDENNATANITLSWNAPNQREDNSILSFNDIKNYTIYYGTVQGQHPRKTPPVNGTHHTITGLPVGTWYFVVTTTDIDGRESQHSTEVAITI